jgi:hypothetical protein
MFYITNSSTKYESLIYRTVMTAAVIKESLERTAATDATDEESMLNFSLRVFNRMSLDKEVSSGI